MNIFGALLIVSALAGVLAAFAGRLALAGEFLRRRFPRLYAFLVACATPSTVLGIGSGNFPSVYHKILGAVWRDAEMKSEPVWKRYLQEKST